MSKKPETKPTKKKNYRLRKSVRRTLGALFMISAIIVAAIPFPDSLATDAAGTTQQDATQNSNNGSADTATALAYAVTITEEDKKEINSGINLAGPKNQDNYDPVSKPDGAVRSAYNMRYSNSEKVWYYQLQFTYYLEGADAILYRYNNEYVETNVELAETVNSGSYIEVPGDEYNNFFATDTTQYTLSYKDYNKDAPTEVQKKFEKYFPTKYEGFLKLVAQFEKKEVTEDKVTVTATVKDDLTLAKRGEYYCEHKITEKYTMLPGEFATKGFTMQSVEKISGNGRTTAYIAYSTDKSKNEAGYRIDTNGFIYLTAAAAVQSYTLKGIADEAFKDVQNVELTITLPETLSYIGNEAFYNSFVKSINIKNVKEIGHRAFMDSRLTELTWPFTQKVGVEAFRNTDLTSVTFPQTLVKVGKGAFAFNPELTTLNFHNHNNLEISEYAFYDCFKLSSQNLADHGIISLGKAAFAVQSPDTGNCTSFKFPDGLDASADIGAYVLANRQQLKEVTMPQQFGYSGEAELDSTAFQGCVNLSYVAFPEDARFAKFGENTFSTVANPEFYVTGPASTTMGGTTPSEPRKSTWPCTLSTGAAVPYRYTHEGKDYYEIKSESYLLSLSVDESNRTATVSKVDVVPGSQGNSKLTINDTVGSYDVTKLGDGCITQDVKNNLGELAIGNNVTEIGASVFENCSQLKTVSLGDGITSIGASAFKNCPALTSIAIGAGVTNIGASAFEDCKALTSIKIAEPAGGTASFPVTKIGEKAFCTNSSKLIIEGKIDEGYGPFEWAMNASNYSNAGMGIRPLYKSPDPYGLGINTDKKISPSIYVIYDEVTGDATAIHYPHYDELKAITAEATKGTSAMNLCAAYEAGNIELTPAEMAVINAALNVEFYPGIDSIDVSSYMRATENQMNVAAYMTGSEAVKEISPYAATYQEYGLFNGNYGDSTDGEYGSSDPNDALYEKEARGNDFVETVTFHTVKSLPNANELSFSEVGDRVKSGAFYSCEKLQSVTLGSAMEDVGDAPFMGCYSMYNVDCTDNPNFICENKILYGNKADGSTELIEVLGSRGNDGNNAINVTTDPALATISEIGNGAFMDCPYLFAVDFTGASNFREIPDDTFRNSSQSYLQVILPENVREIGHRAFGNMDTAVVSIYGREVSLASDSFEDTVTPIVHAYLDSAAYNTAARMPGVQVIALDNTYRVQFLDNGGKALSGVQYVKEGESAEPPEKDPVREGYKFTGWDKSYRDIKEDTLIYATYEIDKSSDYWNTQFPGGTSGNGTGAGTGSGNGTGTGTGTNSGSSSGSTSGDYDKDGNRLYTLTVTGGTGGGKYKAGDKVTITATGGSSGTTFGHWSSSNTNVIFADTTKMTTTLIMPAGDATVIANYAGQYTLVVEYGSGSGSYPAGAKVSISAVEPPAGKKFYKWTTTTSGLTIASSTSSSTTITMPASNAKVTATYSNTTGSGTGSSGSTTTATPSTNKTSVIITRPGISDTDQASAYVSGSSDGFIVKISQSAEADAAALAALEAEYGDMTPIKFAAMDISLYDSTGTTKITDTTGLKINITMPIPDALRAYAGNNKIAAVSGGSLEKLGVKFVTMNGVPCMSFTATHFSPYVVYVDTGNLVAGDVLDQTPKTGDGIHPKWFLSVGLASISMILFLKKDSKSRYKTRLS